MEIKIYGAFVLNHRVVLHAIDATPARWRGDAGSSPLDRARTAASSPRNDLVKNCRVHPTHWLISTQVTQRPVLGDDWVAWNVHDLVNSTRSAHVMAAVRAFEAALDEPSTVLELALRPGTAALVVHSA